MPATASVDVIANMTTVNTNWRLGSDNNPGCFNIGDIDKLKTEFSKSTVFKLCWNLPDPTKDRIYNLLHSVTVGWQHKTSKIHIEHLAQILRGELHVTSRFSDHAGRVHRNTQPLPGGLNNIGQWFRLEYSGLLENNIFSTTAEIYNYNTNTLVQQCKYCAVVDPKNFEFYAWNGNSVDCVHESFGVPCDHVMIHGHTADPAAAFEIKEVSGSIGGTGVWYCVGSAEQDHNVRYRHNTGIQEITVSNV